MPAYSAAKAGAAGLLRSVAREVGRNNITVELRRPRHHEHAGDRPPPTTSIAERAGEEVRDQAPRAARATSPPWCTFLASAAGRVDHRPDLSRSTAATRSRSDRRPKPRFGAPVRFGAMETVDDVRAALAAARVPGRRGPGHRDLPRAAAAAPAAARGRGRRRQDRGGQGAGPLDRRRARAAAVLRGHRRRPGRLRVGLLAPAAAPARGRGRAAARSSRTSSTPSGSW